MSIRGKRPHQEVQPDYWTWSSLSATFRRRQVRILVPFRSCSLRAEMSESVFGKRKSFRMTPPDDGEDRTSAQYRNPFEGVFGRARWHDDQYEHFITPSLEDFPQGYPRLAAHVNSDIDTLLFRRFGWLGCRTLLHFQDELQLLEANLQDLDRKHQVEAPHRLLSKRIDDTYHDEGISYTRGAMVKEIKMKLDSYDDLLARQQFVASMPRPGVNEFRSYFDWVLNDPPVLKEEFQFIYHMDDFLALGTQEDSWQGALVNWISRIIPGALKRVSLNSIVLTCDMNASLIDRRCL